MEITKRTTYFVNGGQNTMQLTAEQAEELRRKGLTLHVAGERTETGKVQHMIELKRKCFECGTEIIISKDKPNESWIKQNLDGSLHVDEDEYKHEHQGMTQHCWDCGGTFCKSCMGYEGNWSEKYCGC